MEQRISMITLGVADLERAVAFYENVVGWKAAPGPPGIAFFDLGGIVFSLYPHDDLAKDRKAVADGARDGYEGFALAHNVRAKEDVDAIFARLREKGAIIGERADKSAGRMQNGQQVGPTLLHVVASSSGV